MTDYDPTQLPIGLQPMQREADVLHRAVDLVRERLPPGWHFRVVAERVELALGQRADALIEIQSPDAKHAVLVGEVRRSVVTRDLSHVLAQLESMMAVTPEPHVPLVIARYLSPSARSWLVDRQVSYADATGNIRIAIESPGLYIRDVGAERDPWRGPGRPRGSLHGEPAARVVRALLDYQTPIGIIDLAGISGASTGATYRVVEFLEQESIIERPKRGPITHVAWRSLLNRWAKDYSFQGTNATGSFLHPRGMPSLLDSLRTADTPYAVTGSLAAHQWAPYAPARLATIYVDSIPLFASAIGLRFVESGANVLLAKAKYRVVFDRAERSGGINFVSPSQAAVDLLTGPGRNPTEAEMLMDWMEKYEREWRRPAPSASP